MSDAELESFEIIIEVIDFNEFAQNILIGFYCIGCGALYRNPQHELFKTWLPLKPTDNSVEAMVF